jgi:hypothetical protein
MVEAEHVETLAPRKLNTKGHSVHWDAMVTVCDIPDRHRLGCPKWEVRLRVDRRSTTWSHPALLPEYVQDFWLVPLDGDDVVEECLPMDDADNGGSDDDENDNFDTACLTANQFARFALDINERTVIDDDDDDEDDAARTGTMSCVSSDVFNEQDGSSNRTTKSCHTEGVVTANVTFPRRRRPYLHRCAKDKHVPVVESAAVALKQLVMEVSANDAPSHHQKDHPVVTARRRIRPYMDRASKHGPKRYGF